MTLSVVALPTVHVDDTAVGLTLLSDLCGMLPPDVTFDFSVVGVDVGLVRRLHLVLQVSGCTGFALFPRAPFRR